MNHVRQLKILTGFRFFAALHVVCFHNFYLFGELQNLLPRFWYIFVQTGESAVSFFFILSGFILTHVYKEKISTKNEKVTYFIARIAKLYPLYLLGLLLDAPPKESRRGDQRPLEDHHPAPAPRRVTGAHAHREAQHACQQQQAEDETEDQHGSAAPPWVAVTTPAPVQQNRTARATRLRR